MQYSCLLSATGWNLPFISSTHCSVGVTYFLQWHRQAWSTSLLCFHLQKLFCQQQWHFGYLGMPYCIALTRFNACPLCFFKHQLRRTYLWRGVDMPVPEWIRCSPFCLELKSSHCTVWNGHFNFRQCYIENTLERFFTRLSLESSQRRVFTASSLIMHYKSWHQLHMYSSCCTFVVLLLIMPLRKVYHLLEEEKKSEGTNLCSYNLCYASFKPASGARETLIKCMLYFTKKYLWSLSPVLCSAWICVESFSLLFCAQCVKVHYEKGKLLKSTIRFVVCFLNLSFYASVIPILPFYNWHSWETVVIPVCRCFFFFWPRRHSQF